MRSITSIQVFLLVSCSVYLVQCGLISQDRLSFELINGGTGTTYGHYGVLGNADPLNHPSQRGYSCLEVDINGNVWLFGGMGFDRNGNVGLLNDLWMFNTTIDQWTWIGGSDQIDSMGDEHTPPARYGASSWYLKQNDNICIFGGQTKEGGPANDMWCYDIHTHRWRWILGSTLPAANNQFYPGSRSFGSTWTTEDNTLWLYGGILYNNNNNNNSPQFSYGSDLWKFEAGRWTFVNGNLGDGESEAMVAVGSSNPGSRYFALTASDDEGNLWLYGGWGFQSASLKSGSLSDLWKYTRSTGQWTLVDGNWQESNRQPSYPSQLGSTGHPGARLSSKMVFSGGKLWLFGGIGMSRNANGKSQYGIHSDFWTFDLEEKRWFWIGGQNQVNVASQFNPGKIQLGGLYAYGSAVRRTEAENTDYWYIQAGRADFESNHFTNAFWRIELNARPLISQSQLHKNKSSSGSWINPLPVWGLIAVIGAAAAILIIGVTAAIVIVYLRKNSANKVVILREEQPQEQEKKEEEAKGEVALTIAA